MKGFKLNHAGFRQLRTSPKVAAHVRQRADRVAAAAGDGFEVVEGASANRARFLVVPTNGQARQANRDSYAVLRALTAGGR